MSEHHKIAGAKGGKVKNKNKGFGSNPRRASIAGRYKGAYKTIKKDASVLDIASILEREKKKHE